MYSTSEYGDFTEFKYGVLAAILESRMRRDVCHATITFNLAELYAQSTAAKSVWTTKSCSDPEYFLEHTLERDIITLADLKSEYFKTSYMLLDPASLLLIVNFVPFSLQRLLLLCFH